MAGPDMTVRPETTLSSTRVFAGRLLNIDLLEVEIEPGVRSRREIVRHPGAIAVIARLPDGRFAFVRQFRKAIERELLEIVAGGLEKNESPADCARREIMEETGHDTLAVVPLGTFYPAPGYTDEILHIFFAELSADSGAHAGDHDERIEVEYRTEAEFNALIDRGEIHDAKTLAAWTLFKRSDAHPMRVQSSPDRR
jgi:ADP-ribose pyrophosphatase